MADISFELQQVGEELKGYLEQDGVHHYKLALPNYLYGRLQQLARQENTTVMDIIRRSVKLGLLIADTEMEPGTEVIIRRPGQQEQRLVFLV